MAMLDGSGVGTGSGVPKLCCPSTPINSSALPVIEPSSTRVL
jgi:hypothetical protein